MAVLWREMRMYEIQETIKESCHTTSNLFLPLQVSQELIRMAILWHEMWHEALEEASRQYFGESNVEAMLSTLMPLHEMMQANGGITLKEIAFVKVRLPFDHTT